MLSRRRFNHWLNLLLVGVFLSGGTVVAWGQWLANGTPVATGSGRQAYQVIAPDGAGGMIVAWEGPGASGADVFSQRVSPAGALLWNSNGVTLASAPGDQSALAIAPDGAGGAFVAWTDRRAGNSNEDVYLQRVSSSGELAPGWPANGRPVAAQAGEARNARLLADGVGGVFVVWEDARSGTFDIYAQRIGADGSVASGWPTDGLILCAAAGDQKYARIATDSAGGLLVIWEDERAGVGTGVPYVQRLSASGEAVWAAGGVAAMQTPGSSSSLVMCPDGSGGAFCAWNYNDWSSSDSEVYLQHITASGSIASSWGPDGVVVCEAAYQRNPFGLFSDGYGGVFVAWSDGRETFSGTGGSNIDFDLYLQHVTVTGVPADAWPINGRVILDDICTSGAASMIADGSGGFLFIWEKQSCSPNYNIYAKRVMDSGATAPGWPEGGLGICTDPSTQWQPLAILSEPAHAIVSWFDNRAGSQDLDVYAQRIRLSDGLVEGSSFFDFASGPGPDFSVINEGSLWTVGMNGPNLPVSKSSDDLSFNGQGFVSGGVRSNFTIDGDFTVTVDYSLPDFAHDPAGPQTLNESIVELYRDDVPDPAPYFEVLRFVVGDSPTQLIEGFSSLGGFGSIVSPAEIVSAGRFRVTRTGTTMTAWFAAPGSETFTSLGSQTSNTFLGPMRVQLVGVQGTNIGGVNRARNSLAMSFDNLIVDGNLAYHFTIAALAGAGGTISPSGNVSVVAGQSQTFSISPDACQVISDVLVDGTSVGPVTSYAFSNVSNSHSIEAQFHTAVQAASIAFDAQQYPAVSSGLLHVTLQNDGPLITVLVSPVIRPRYRAPIEPQPVSVILQSMESRVVTFPWTAPAMSGQSPVDATVTIEAGGCSIAPVTVLGRAVVSELTTAQIEAAQQQLNECGTTTGQSCDAPDPKDLLVGLIPIWGTGVTAAKAAQNGCLATEYWNQGRHAQSVTMWMATTANGVSAVSDAVDIAACVTLVGCAARIVLSAPEDLALDLTSGLAVCLTHLLDLLSFSSSFPTSSANAANDMMMWLPDSLYESFRVAGDTLDLLAFASGPVTLRVMTDSVSTTSDTLAHTGAVVVPMPAQSMTYASLRRDLALLGRPDSTVGPPVLRVAAFEPGRSTFDMMRGTPDGPVRVTYAPFDLDSGGTAAMTNWPDSTGSALRVDVDGDGRVDYIHYPGGMVVGVSPDRPGDRPFVGRVQLSAAHPNPTHGGTTFVLRVGQAPFSGRLVIQDIAGRLVASQPVHSESPGEHILYWPGTSNSGLKVDAGVYYASVIANGIRSHARSVILIR